MARLVLSRYDFTPEQVVFIKLFARLRSKRRRSDDTTTLDAAE